MPSGYNTHMTRISTQRENIELTKHRERISELLLQHYTKAEMKAIILEEFGIELSTYQLNRDIEHIQMSWIAQMTVNYDLLINQEIARLDALEAELWRQLRRSGESRIKEVIDRLPIRVKDNLEDEDVRYIISKIQTAKEGSQVNPIYFSRIIDVQKERRRLLGMYAPKRTEVALHHTIEVKGYDIVSPDDWDDVIEGRIVHKIEANENWQEEIPD